MNTAVAAAPAPQATQRVPSPWIAGPAFDLTFFIGSGLLGFFILGVNALIPSGMTLLLCAVVSICLDQVHNFHTFSRTYFDLAEFRRARFFYVATVVVVFAVFLGVWFAGMSYALSLVIYAAVWHQTKQHYGFVRIYDKRRPQSQLGRWDSWLDNFCLFGGILAPILYVFRLDHLGELDRPLVYPHVPVQVAYASLGLIGAGFVAMAVREAVRLRRFGEVAIQKCLVIFMAVAPVAGAAMLESQLIVILVAVTSFHATQYIAITWLYNRNKYAEGFEEAPDENPFTSKLIRQKKWWIFYACGIFYGVFTASIQRWDLLVPVAYTFAGVHYVVDARIWKIKYCPDLKKNLRPPV
jgi:hypothetical protein